MDELLLNLVNYLKSKFINDGIFNLKGVFALSEYEAATLLSIDKVPCIIVTTIREAEMPGPFGDTLTRKMYFRLRIIARSADPLKYKQEVNSYNIYAMSDAVRAALAANKMLGIDPATGKTVGLNPDQNITDLDVITSSGSFNARDIDITYDVMETWTGKRNDQSSLLAPIPDAVLI